MRAARRGLVFLAITIAAPPSPALAQLFTLPAQPWETIHTPNFDVHFPRAMRPWAIDVAGRLEAVRGAVIHAVGSAPAHRVTVVIDDPYNVSNGAALPVLHAPTIVLWPTPPDPTEDVGPAPDWAEVLTVHEFTHIAHLTRPTRNPVERTLWSILPVDLSPIAWRAPRWVIEGYATYVEGLLTGSGRPHGVARAAILRELAIEGQMPSYAELNGSGRFLGGDMPYLVGSAFLEWLVARSGESSLPHLWRRMTARRNRDFAGAFLGVFGDVPAALYGRFVADLTVKARDAADSIAAAGLDTGTTFQHLTWYTGDPAVSRDGRLVAVPVRSPVRPARIVVWSTEPQPGVDSAIAAARARLVAADPEDVPAVAIYPPPRRPVAVLEASRRLGYDAPRFFARGDRVLVTHDEPLPDGAFRPDLYIWHLRTGRVTRLTRHAAVRSADPAPDGHWAAGVRCLSGICDLVRIDIPSGTVRTLLAGSPTRQFYRPRIAPDGGSLVVAVHGDDRWHLEVLPLADGRAGEPHAVGPPDGASRYGATYVAAGTALVTVSELGGTRHLEVVDLASGGTRPLALTTGSLLAPDAGTSDSTVLFLSQSARGRDLHMVHLAAARPIAPPVLPPALAPAAVPGPAAQFDSFPPVAVQPPTRYLVGPREYRYLPGGAFGPAGRYATLLVGSSDPVGRLGWTLQGALGDPGAWRGGAAAAIWRRLPVAVTASAFALTQYPSREGVGSFVSPSLDVGYRGAVLSAGGRRYGSFWSSTARVGGSAGRLAVAGRPGHGRELLFASYAGTGDFSRGPIALLAGVAAMGTAGRTDGTPWRRLLARGGLIVGTGGARIRYTVGYATVDRGAPVFERPIAGGETPPLTDTALLSQRIAVPALPLGVVAGRELTDQRLEDDTGPFTLYYERLTSPADRSAHHDVYGAELRAGLPAVPFLAVPSVSALAGAGYSASAPFKYKLRGYLAVRYTP